MRHLQETGYTHHIERLMVFGNLCLTVGIEPQAMMDWMWSSFVDGAEWVMAMCSAWLFTLMVGPCPSKPYTPAGRAPQSRMSDSCRNCAFDPSEAGDDACPYTTLYWDFLDRHRDTLSSNHRLSLQYRNLSRLSDLESIRVRANEGP